MIAIKGWRVLVVAMLVSMSGLVSAAQSLPAGTSFEAGFSPGQGALDVVLKGIGAAKKQILVAAYSFTSKPVATALVEAKRRGVNVFVVADQAENSKGYTAATFLANAGVQVRLNGKYSILHHKFMVIDGEHLQLGSFNYSSAAVSKNAENVLLLWHAQAIADTYSAEWKRLWDEATPLAKAY
ncbi:phospholipase D family nuclease [Cupriavidus pinatubonensis]|uniref:phospholipase D n=1 Tax=Cupriavidus pinatubonensis TaxID=248026 RepID=A0ABN7Y981_9BURK|nr:phospholipase D family protein [Cupriavidus pinatubonensis]CAG9169955.1 Cardiolipin synthase B [Cupriavidus pinatubonensis]